MHPCKQPLPQFTLLVTFLLIALFLALTSSQLGPLRWPFRVLPVFSAMLGLGMMWLLNFGSLYITRLRTIFFWLAILLSAWMQFFSTEDTPLWTTLLSLLFFLLPALILFLRAKRYFLEQRTIPASFLAVLSIYIWCATLAHHPAPLFASVQLPKSIEQAGSTKGYTLTLCNEHHSHPSSTSLEHIASAQFLLFDTPAINGYSPVGHKGINRIFPYHRPQGNFSPKDTLENITQPSTADPTVYDAQLLNITYLWMSSKDLTTALQRKLERAGLHQVESPTHNDTILLKQLHLPARQGSLTYQSNGGGVTFTGDEGMRLERFNVPSSTQPRTLIFSRVFWPGYTATINGTVYPATAYRDLLVQIDLPAGASGPMTLSYTPISWAWTKWSLGLGVLIFGSTTFWLRRTTTSLSKSRIMDNAR